MSQWFVGAFKQSDSPDLAVLEETALAMAQATISNAMAAAKVSRAEMARRMALPRSAITRMLSGGHNLTVKTMARAMATCGCEPRFVAVPLHWGWSEELRVESSVSDLALTEGRDLPSPPFFYSNSRELHHYLGG